jgi:hypothetical protein
MKKRHPIHPQKHRLGFGLCCALTAGLLAISETAQAQGRSAEVLAEHTLAPLSLLYFGLTEEELIIAQANGLARTDLPAIGSGLQRLAGNHFVGITDRGPAFARSLPSAGRVFPMPSFTPHIAIFQARGGELVPQALIPIVVDDDGTPATGITNGRLEDAVPFDNFATTNALPFNPNGLDPEDVHTLPDGSFIIVDEHSPSLAIISDSGKVLKRYTPEGRKLEGAAYPVSDNLPAILKDRRPSRGFECIAISRDGRTAYTMTQSPMGPTGAGTPTRNSRVLRVLELDVSDPLDIQVTGQFVLLMSLVSTYPPGNRPQDLKLSAAAWVSEKKLLLLERTDEAGIGGAKLILADLTEATDVSGWLTLDLEDSNLDLALAGITPAATTVVYSNEETPEVDDFKLEGLAILNRNTVAMVNDNDFGDPAGASTRMWVIRLRDSLP